MLATLTAQLPLRGEHLYELKWDGVRAISYIDRGRAEMLSRNDLPMTLRYPEFTTLWQALRRRRMILDGEVIALDDDNCPSFPLLQHRMHVDDPADIARLALRIPAYYMVFDLLYLDGESLTQRPLSERRDVLLEQLPEGDAWKISPASDDGEALLAAARERHMEGVVCKRAHSTYQPGRRSLDWLKVKLVDSQEFVIGGWIPELGSRAASRIGSLLLGYYDTSGKLRYAGRVGTGFSDEWHQRLTALLRQRRLERTPFGEKVDGAAIFVEPAMVAQVEYRRWPEGSKIQQAAFKGLREDKPARDVSDERRQRRTPGRER
jgi:bifunctional non-homologous end joining protein LigD